MKKKALPILLALVLIAVGVFGYKYYKTKSSVDPNVIRVSGNIEATDAEVSFKTPGIVEARLVNEGETIRAGQLVARLDKTEVTQEVAMRRAEVQAAQAALAELLAGSRPEDIAQAEAAVGQSQARLDELLAGSRSQEIAAAEATVQGAKAEVERMKKEYWRSAQLREAGVVSAQEDDLIRTTYQTTQAKEKEAEERLKLIREGPRKEQITQARAALSEAKARLNLVRKGPRQETIEQARARLQQATDALAQAETRLSYTTISSPISGVVLSKNIEPGEHVAPGTPIVTVGELSNVWLRAYIDETDLGRVKVGHRVKVTTDTYPGKVYEGRISFIASEAEFTPKNVQTQKERVKLVYRVKVDIANPSMELKPGMPADAVISLTSDTQVARQ
jgi:HlyD family secretion protein